MKMHNLWKTIVESLQGLNNNGSSKRATAFGFFLLSAILVISYASMYVYVVIKDSNSNLHASVESLMWPMFGTVVSTLLTALGFTTWEMRSNNKKEVELKKAETKPE